MKYDKILLFLFVVNVSTIFAQEFQGQAMYEFKFLRSKSIDKAVDEEKVSLESKIDDEQFEAAFAKASLKKYTLKFSAFNSEFAELQALEKPEVKNDDGITMTISFNKGVLYKDLKTKKSVEERSSLDNKAFLVEKSLDVFEWTIGNETKKIGNFNCIKAIAIIKVTEEQQKDYEEKIKNRKSISAFTLKTPKDIEVTAWFTNEIPISNGPAKYQGLPGLILELTAGKELYICSKIILNPKNKLKIEAPTKGKSISEDDYIDREAKLYKKMANEDGVIYHETVIKD